MNRMTLAAVTATLLLAGTGCATTNRIVGHDLVEAGIWYGELGITGHLNKITVKSRSRLTKLSIIGDANQIVVEDGATLGKIEVWGANNTLIVSDYLVVRVNQFGQGNQLTRRPRQALPFAGTPPTQGIEVDTPVEPMIELADEETALPLDADDTPE